MKFFDNSEIHQIRSYLLYFLLNYGDGKSFGFGRKFLTSQNELVNLILFSLSLSNTPRINNFLNRVSSDYCRFNITSRPEIKTFKQAANLPIGDILHIVDNCNLEIEELWLLKGIIEFKSYLKFHSIK
jgi:hypothetical protein